MEEKKKNKSSTKKIIAWVVITNIITISILLFVPIPFLGKRLVDTSDYNFLVDYRKLVRVHHLLDKQYVDKITPEQEEKMLEGAINGMTNALGDPYTTYMNKKQFEGFLTQTTGEYAGVGIVVGVKDNELLVVDTMEKGPATKAGILPGDVIVNVDGTEVNGKESEKAVSLMKGKPNTEVVITVKRPSVGEKTFKMKREKIQLETIKTEVIDGIGYIKITSFDEHTGKNFKAAIEKLQQDKVKGLIVDLRNNPGGILNESIKVLDELVDKADVLSTIDNGGQKTVYKTNDGKINVPLVLLVNGGSASASEIVAGAIKDLKAGTLIGTKTFGKGLVQGTADLQDGSALKVTVARYYTPSGVCIQGTGIEPNIVVEMPKGETALPLKDDPQFKKAVEVINSEAK